MTLVERFTHLVGLVRAAIGAHLARQLRPPQPVWLGERLFVPVPPPQKRPPLPEPVWTLLYLRLGRLLARFAALHAKWRANALPRPRAPRPSRPRPRPATPPLRLPRAFAWVNHRIPECAPPTGLLKQLLHAEPELRRFVADAPSAGRLLRPLCQALGLRQPDWLRLPPRPRRPRPQPPRPPRERPLALTDPRLGLQPYVIAAVRHGRKSGRT